MTQEKKAKAYDEAIERAKKWYNAPNVDKIPTFGNRVIEEIFPELIEPEDEDEKIRKGLIENFKWFCGDFPETTKWGKDDNLLLVKDIIAWLEKQKTSEEAIQYLKENHSPSEVSDFQAAMNIAVAKAYDKGVKDGLENRGQTFTKEDVDDAYLKGVRDAKKELKKISQRMISAEAKEAMYGKPIDKVELKFRVGDVVCDKSCTTLDKGAQPNYEIVDIRNGLYICDKGYIPISYQDEYELVAKKIENEIEIPFGAKDSELQEAAYFIPKGFHAEIDDDKVVIKKGEKPTAWSDGDKKMCQETIDWFEKKCFPYALESENPARESIKWLNSLKDRCTWKPSEKQMEALKEACDEHWEPDGLDPLYTLYQELKKLREE